MDETAWKEDLGAFLAGIWAELGDLVHERAGFAGLASLATVGLDGGARLRSVVLRRADRRAGQLILHSDAKAEKVAEIEANPQVTVMVWTPRNALQIRARGKAQILGPYAAQDAWAELPFASRGNYGVTPPPGTPIETAEAYRREADPRRLAVISVTLNHIDAVQLCRPAHIRAQYSADDGWHGRWVAP